MYSVGMLVDVQSRTGPYMNKYGGVGRVTACFSATADKPERYNIKYVLGGAEKGVVLHYIDPLPELEKRSSSVLKDASSSANVIAGKVTDVEQKQKQKRTSRSVVKGKNKSKRLRGITLRKGEKYEKHITDLCDNTVKKSESGESAPRDKLIGLVVTFPKKASDTDIDDDISIESINQCIPNDDETKNLDLDNTKCNENDKLVLEPRETKPINKAKKKVKKLNSVTEIGSKNITAAISSTKQKSLIKCKQLSKDYDSTKILELVDEKKRKQAVCKRKRKDSNKMRNMKDKKAQPSGKNNSADEHVPKVKNTKEKKYQPSVKNNSGKGELPKTNILANVDDNKNDCNSTSEIMSVDSNRFSTFTALTNMIFRNGRDVVNIHDLRNFINYEGNGNFTEAETKRFLGVLDKENLIMFDDKSDMIYLI